MTSEQFKEELKALLTKHDIGWQWDCDYIPLSTGMLLYAKGESGDYDNFLTHVTGIHFNDSNELDGDLEGFLKEVAKELEELSPISK